MTPLDTLQAALGYRFRDPALLSQALTHRSHGSPHNERLEFLGDSVLNFVVSSLLFAEHGEMNEGELSRVRANLVKQAALADIAQTLALSNVLRLGEGELKSGGFRRPSILADAVEAILGALYLDGGYEAVRRTIERLYRPMLSHIDVRTFGKDPKTLLQEMVQGLGFALPRYAVVATRGAAHDQTFDVECEIAQLNLHLQASGPSRRSAEQAAATQAIAKMEALGESAGRHNARGGGSQNAPARKRRNPSSAVFSSRGKK